MAKGKIHEHPNANTNGFKQNPENINPNGRPMSIKNQLQELLNNQEGIVIKKDQIIEQLEGGDIMITMPTKKMVAMKLLEWVRSDKGANSLKALQIVIEQIDGKPKQEVEQTNSNNYNLHKLTENELLAYQALVMKMEDPFSR